MSLSNTQNRLRLVGLEDPTAVASWNAARAVRDENLAAAHNHTLDPTDPRWVVAVRTQAQLQGATLTPDRRERVMRTARQLGVRPFEANVIMAVVQDHARRGLHLSETTGVLRLIEPPGTTRRRRLTLLRWGAAIATAITANALLIWWLIGA